MNFAGMLYNRFWMWRVRRLSGSQVQKLLPEPVFSLPAH
jgi:hypothetical protein